VDSDDEWEDEGEGESIDNSGDEDDMTDEEDEDDDGFFVPHGHLSDDEIDEENRIVYIIILIEFLNIFFEC
jgi:hypothetical protein